MQLFVDYVEPLTAWLQLHPHWSLFIAFFVAFIESLAVIGSIVPGTVVMTALGILAGSGIMRIDLTLTVSAIGAIAGDGASYMLGYILSERIPMVWPFSRYPRWITYGEEYFKRHGGKSVILGRFIGPLRSIIPVIAGMLKMNQIQFFLANVISGIAWAIVYITPGIIVGTASTELSAEGATRLFLLIFILLVLAWLLTLAIKWVLSKLDRILRKFLNELWSWFEYHRFFSFLTHHFTPPNEQHHAKTVAIILLSLVIICILVSVILWSIFVDELGYLVDLPIYFFFQSLRTQIFDIVFTFVNCFINPHALLVFWIIFTIYCIKEHHWRLLKYWISLGITTFFITQALGVWIHHLRLEDAPIFQSTFSFPSAVLAMSTALFGFLACKLNHSPLKKWSHTIRLIFTSLLVLYGFSLLYLGTHWTSSVLISYALGASICLIHWLFYRRRITKKNLTTSAFIASAMGLMAVSLVVICLQFKQALLKHQLYPEQYVLTNIAWWHQREPLLPMYTMNRFGRPNGILNIQYLGSLDVFQKALESVGWQQRPNSFAARLLTKSKAAPFKPMQAFKMSLYLHQKPQLVMTYLGPNHHSGLVLSLWRSNYHLRNYKEPLWLGSLQPYPMTAHTASSRLSNKKNGLSPSFLPFQYLLSALEGFEFNTLPLPFSFTELLSENDYPLLLMIRETP